MNGRAERAVYLTTSPLLLSKQKQHAPRKFVHELAADPPFRALLLTVFHTELHRGDRIGEIRRAYGQEAASVDPLR